MPTSLPWKLRDTIAALAFAMGTLAFVFWQNAHVAVLWDLAYLLDSSWRFSLALHGGPLPYRDLPFAHAPLTFLVQGILIRLFGRVYWHHVLYAALAGAAGTLLTWRIALRLLPHRWRVVTLLCVPLIPLGIYSVYPHPIYDSDCVLSLLLALYLLLRADAACDSDTHAESTPYLLLTADLKPVQELKPRSASLLLSIAAGAACVVPIFYKQNIGLLFIGATLACVTAILVTRARSKEPITPQIAVLAGAAIAFAATLFVLHHSVTLGKYFYWTFTFAAQRRLPGLSTLLGVYAQPSLFWTVPVALAAVVLLRRFPTSLSARIVACALLAAPLVYAAIIFRISDDPSDASDALLSLWPHLLVLCALFALWQLRCRPTLPTLLPAILLATIHGTFLSQQLWGSTYALWPLLILLLALVLRQMYSLALPLTLIITAVFLPCGTRYALSLERLSYNHMDGALAYATLPSLRGMATPGPYLPQFEELVRATDEMIPFGDGVLLIPGQVPFYYATGRKPQFPVLLIDTATNPYSPTGLRDEARRRNIQWLIVNRNLQLTADPVPNLVDFVKALGPDFAPARTLSGYTIYHRRVQGSSIEDFAPETAATPGPS